MWIATAQQCKEIDRHTREQWGISSAELMENAGKAVFKVVEDDLMTGDTITVLCGKGNNGGDGLVVARLAQKAKLKVRCLIAAEKNELSPDSQERLQEALDVGVTVTYPSHPNWKKDLRDLHLSGLVVDALLGIGARGEVTGHIRECIEAMQDAIATVIAVDVPSGIDTDTGAILGVAVKATKTITLGLPKRFLFQGEGQEYSGDWEVADIGLPDHLLSENRETDILIDTYSADHRFPPRRSKTSHKGANGSVLIVAGSIRYPGAATLATMGAIHSGAGLVTVAAPQAICDIVAHHVPEAIFLPLPETNPAEAILAEMDRYDAAVFGPGKTTEEPILDFWRALWPNWTKPCIIDADGLNALALGIDPPKASFAITPHPGEAARLLGIKKDDINARRFEVVKQLADKFQCAALLKGANSMIADHEEHGVFVNLTGNPGMASAGMGDVLSGVVGTLLAQGLESIDALICAAYWHGYAGDCLSHGFGITASALARELPAAYLQRP
jgi:NAD(P)H-hydrate epimerase